MGIGHILGGSPAIICHKILYDKENALAINQILLGKKIIQTRQIPHLALCELQPLFTSSLYNNKPIDGSERTKSLFKWAQLTILVRLRDQFRLGSLRENFSPVSEMRKGDEFWRVVRKNKAKMAKHKVYHSLGILLANSSIIAVQMGCLCCGKYSR